MASVTIAMPLLTDAQAVRWRDVTAPALMMSILIIVMATRRRAAGTIALTTPTIAMVTSTFASVKAVRLRAATATDLFTLILKIVKVVSASSVARIPVFTIFQAAIVPSVTIMRILTEATATRWVGAARGVALAMSTITGIASVAVVTSTLTMGTAAGLATATLTTLIKSIRTSVGLVRLTTAIITRVLTVKAAIRAASRSHATFTALMMSILTTVRAVGRETAAMTRLTASTITMLRAAIAPAFISNPMVVGTATH